MDLVMKPTAAERFAQSLPDDGACTSAYMTPAMRQAVRDGLVRREKVSVGWYRYTPLNRVA